MLGSIEIENFGDLKRKDLKNWWYFDGVFIILMETLDKFRHSMKILKVPPFKNFKKAFEFFYKYLTTDDLSSLHPPSFIAIPLSSAAAAVAV